MDYTTSVGHGLSQHQAAELTRDIERRRRIAERLASAPPANARRRAAVDFGGPAQVARFGVTIAGIAATGALLAVLVLPFGDAGGPAPASAVVIDAPPAQPVGGAGGMSDGRFIAR